MRPEPEEALLAALARLQAAGGLGLGEGQPLRRVVPGARPARAGVGPRPRLHAEEWAAPAAAFATRLDEALAVDAPLTDAERRARDALAGKQITLR